MTTVSVNKGYEVFIRHAKKLTKSPHIRDRHALKGIKHYENGDLAVTDSHRLYYGKNLHDKGEILLSPEGRKLNKKYPEIHRLFPHTESESITLDINEMLTGIGIIDVAAKHDIHKKDVMKWQSNKLSSDVSGVIGAQYELPYTIDTELYSDTKYWIDALKMLKAFKYAEVELNIYGKFLPFTLTSLDDKITALILPVRVY